MLRSLYSQLLTLARTESAFSQGYTFDLTYCNPQHSATKFIFARRPRKTFYNPSPEDSLIIICADFSFASQDEPRQIDVVLPDALFSLWNIPQSAEYKVQELLPTKSVSMLISTPVSTQDSTPVPTPVPTPVSTQVASSAPQSATRAVSTATPQPVIYTMRTISSAAPLTINLNPIGLTILKLVR